MKKRLLTVAVLMGAWSTYAQVGIGTTSPNRSAQLEISADDKGILIPNVALASSTDEKTISNKNVNSLLVFNTNTTEDLSPGYYYWYEDKWLRLSTSEGVDKNTTNHSIEIQENLLVITDTEGHQISIAIDDIALMEEFVTKLVQNNEFITQLHEVLYEKFGNVVYNPNTNEFTYINEDGDVVTIDWADFNTVNETFTLVDDKLTITDSEGNTVALAVTEIAKNEFFITELSENTEFITELTHLSLIHI